MTEKKQNDSKPVADLERQFKNFLEYVPYLDGNEKTYSFKLLNLILSIGGHVDSALKEMARYPDFSNNPTCKKIVEKLHESENSIKSGRPPLTIAIGLCLEAFEKEYEISKKRVIFKQSAEKMEIIPFEPSTVKSKIPDWWRVYNGLKHDVTVNIKEANLQNALKALASAFLLNVIHKPAISVLNERGVFKPALKGGAYFTGDPKKYLEKNKVMNIGFVETNIFIFDYRQGVPDQTKYTVAEPLGS